MLGRRTACGGATTPPSVMRKLLCWRQNFSIGRSVGSTLDHLAPTQIERVSLARRLRWQVRAHLHGDTEEPTFPWRRGSVAL
jgi:hypothetical protein